MNWPISTLIYRTAVTVRAMTNRIRPATRNRGRARRASKVLDGSKKMPLRVSGVDISGPDAVVLGGVIGSLSYRKALSVWAYSSIPPQVFGALIAILVLFLKAPETIDPETMVATNPAALMSEGTSKVLLAFLSQFDVLRFYGMFLAALGLRKMAKLSSGQAWGVVIALWAILLLLRVGSAAIFGG